MADPKLSDQIMRNPNGGSVPYPDPTVRTVEQLTREIMASREIVESKIDGTRTVLETRLSGMDKAIELLQAATNKIPAQIQDNVSQLKDLHEEKFQSVEARTAIQFSGIQTQFVERDKRTEQLSLADKTAVAAALQAQKESAASTDESNRIANTKMETNFTKLIEQTQALLQQNTRNTDDKINDIKSRLDKGEGRSTFSDPAIADAVKSNSEAIKSLSMYRDTTVGHAQGTKDYTALIISVGAALIAVIPVIVLVFEKIGAQ